MNASRFRLLDLQIDLGRQQVIRDGALLDVQGLSFQLLACLLRHGGAVVDFDQLMAQVWAPALVNEETVTQRVKLLRQSLGDDSRAPRYIRSVRGRGYQLCEPPMPWEEAPATATATRSPRQYGWVALAMLISLSLGAALWWRHASSPAANAEPTATQALVQRAAYYAGIGQRENNERAIGLYQQALHETPQNADARIGLSRAYSARVCLYNFPYEWAGHARSLADEAVKAEPRRASTWSALAYARDCLGDMHGAVDAYERAVALDPNDDASRASAAYLYQEQGRLADALRANLTMRGDASRVRFRDVQLARELELLGFSEAAERRMARSFQLNPDNVFSNIAWPRHLFLQGRPIEAQTALDQALSRNTPHVELYVLAGELALQRGDRDAALKAFHAASQLRPQMSLPATLAAIYSPTMPTPAWFAERIAGLREQATRHLLYPAEWLEIAMLAQAHGDRNAALVAVDEAVRDGYSDSAYLQSSPLLRQLAAEPRYAAAIDIINRRIARQRQQVLAADWCPPELRDGSP